MLRITNEEIEGAIELFVNSIYDCGSDSDWTEASLADWEKAVYEELVTWKTDNKGSYWHSSENRFVGKDKIVARIRPMIIDRLKDLAKEGYPTKAVEGL